MTCRETSLSGMLALKNCCLFLILCIFLMQNVPKQQQNCVQIVSLDIKPFQKECRGFCHVQALSQKNIQQEQLYNFSVKNFHWLDHQIFPSGFLISEGQSVFSLFFLYRLKCAKEKASDSLQYLSCENYYFSVCCSIYFSD